jgi:hypothetical protein
VLQAVLERITYANEETGYTIARVATDRSGLDLLTVGCAAGGAAGGEPNGLALNGQQDTKKCGSRILSRKVATARSRS